jgi:hypothetical protein
LTLTLSLLAGLGAFLLILLAWLLHEPREGSKRDVDLGPAEEAGRGHVTFFPQVRQAMDVQDFVFLTSRGSRALSRRVRDERRKIALDYLSCLRQDFLNLWRLARVIASLSPQVGMIQEAARLRLGLGFALRYELIRLKFRLGFAPLPQLGSLNDLVSALSLRLETAMQEMGERAALAAKLASSLDRRGLDTP